MMIDCMDLKFRFQEKKNQMHGQVNAVDETLVFQEEQNVEKEAKVFVNLGNNIEARTIELQFNEKLGIINEQNYLNLIVINVLVVCSVELNLVEFPSPLPLLWYLDSKATHHVNNNLAIFFTMQHLSSSNLHLVGGQEHEIEGSSDVNIQFFNGVVKSTPHVLYSLTIQKNLLSIGFIVDQNHNIEFFSESCFVQNCYTKELVAFVERENGKGLYRVRRQTMVNPSREINLIIPSSLTKAEIWHK